MLLHIRKATAGDIIRSTDTPLKGISIQQSDNLGGWHVARNQQQSHTFASSEMTLR
jgi:ribosomal protein S3